VREAEEAKRLGFPEAPCLSILGGEPPELDQPRLVGVQHQPELRESLTQLGQEPPRIVLMLESDDEIVRPAHDDHITVPVAASPPVSPQVKDVVEVDVRHQRRRRRALRRALHGR
jgi:hypothetical protein